MVRIGGKGMTLERDRIQENANKYIVKNCPAITEYKFPDKVHKYCCQCTYGYCKDINCIIKQIITICKWYKMSKEDMKRCKESADIIRGSKYGRDSLAIQILQLFDIEEIK